MRRGIALLAFSACRYHFDALDRTGSGTDGNDGISDSVVVDGRPTDGTQMTRRAPRAIARVAGQQINDASVFATRNMTLAAGTFLVVDVAASLISRGTPRSPTTVTLPGVNFTRLHEFIDSVDGYYSVSRWVAKVPSAQTAVVTITFPVQMEIALWSVTELQQTDMTMPTAAFGSLQGEVVTNRTQHTTVMPAATVAGSGVLVSFVAEGPNAASPLQGSSLAPYVELADQGGDSGGVALSLVTVFRESYDAAPALTWSGQANRSMALGAEIIGSE